MNYNKKQIHDRTEEQHDFFLHKKLGSLIIKTMFAYKIEYHAEIHSTSLDEEQSFYLRSGEIIGSEVGSPCGLVIPVEAGDVIQIIEYDDSTSQKLVFHYKVSRALKLVRIGSKTDIARKKEQINDLSEFHLECPTTLLDSNEASLQIILDGNHPEWLAKILKRQVNCWRKDNPEILWRHLPHEVGKDEIKSIVTRAPYLALKNFKDRLTKKQLLDCVTHSTEGAIKFAFEVMDNDSIYSAIYDYPHTLLKFAAKQMNEIQLSSCVFHNGYAAIDFRNNFSSCIKAQIFSEMSISSREILFGYKDLTEEILDSLKYEFETWVRFYEMNEKKCSDIFAILVENEVLEPSKDWQWFSKNLSEDRKVDFLNYIASYV